MGAFTLGADVNAGIGLAVEVEAGGGEAIAGMRVLGQATFPFALLGFGVAHGDHAVGDGHGALGEVPPK